MPRARVVAIDQGIYGFLQPDWITDCGGQAEVMKRFRMFLILLLILVLPGCSSRMWYDGLQMVREKACYDLDGNQREECLKTADTSYDQYQQERNQKNVMQNYNDKGYVKNNDFSSSRNDE